MPKALAPRTQVRHVAARGPASPSSTMALLLSENGHAMPESLPVPSSIWVTSRSMPGGPPQWTLAADYQRALAGRGKQQAGTVVAIDDEGKQRRRQNNKDDNSSLPFDDDRFELENLWQSSRLNQWYEPIEKIPVLGPPPDPRRLYGDKPPSCCTVESVPRHHRIIHRWQSMPQLRGQLPTDHLRTIDQAFPPPIRESTADVTTRRLRALHQRRNPGSRGGDHPTPATALHSGEPSPAVSHREPSPARSPEFIPCTCCVHTPRKPWLANLGAAAIALVAEATNMDEDELPLPIERSVSKSSTGTTTRCGVCGGDRVEEGSGGGADAECI